jgi:diguanylate cyclase (GGDEF)-like protein
VEAQTTTVMSGRKGAGTSLRADRDVRVRARSLVYLFAACSSFILLSNATVPGPAKWETTAAAAVGFGIALGLAVYDKLPAWFAQILLACGSVLVEWVVWASGGTSTTYTVFYFWIAIYAFYFFSTTQAIAQIVFIFLSYSAVVGFVDDPTSPAALSWMLTTSALVVAGAMIGGMKHRIDGLLLEATESARTDGLTGLANRRAFEELLAAEYARAQRSAGRFALLICDLDRFKQLNDTHGHQEGDRALERVGALLREQRRPSDGVARIGGEEFAIILPDVNEHGAYVFAERIRRRVAEVNAGHPGNLTMSIGIATFPNQGTDKGSLMRNADQALYVAKEMGRDQCVLFNSATVETVSTTADTRTVDPGGERHLTTALALAEVLDIRDAGTAAHSQTVGRYAEGAARELGLPPERAERVRYAGIVHDVGKIGVPDSILQKAGPLTEDEYRAMQKHPEIGARLLSGTDLNDISSWVLAHHERPDGKGYPYGLSGEQIPLEARILAVADAYEAMTNDRVYRRALPIEDAQSQLTENAGSQFDARVVQAFLRALAAEEARAYGARPSLPSPTLGEPASAG